jgi:hypothetical protein
MKKRLSFFTFSLLLLHHTTAVNLFSFNYKIPYHKNDVGKTMSVMAPEVIYSNDFEDCEDGYSEFGSYSDGSSDYFIRTNGSIDEASCASVPTSGNLAFTNTNGYYYTGEDVDRPAENPNVGGEFGSTALTSGVHFNDINVSSYTNVEITCSFAASATNQFENVDYIRIYIDKTNNGTYELLGAFESANGLGNVNLSQDTDLDGSGDGTALTQAFQSFSFSVSGASTMDVRIELQSSGSNEEIAFDSFSVTGELASSSATWTGATNNDWDTTTNWNTNVVPTASTDVTIPNGLTNYPTATSAITVNSVSMASGSSLIAQSTFSGNITYTRNLPTSNFYLISSPVVGQDIDAFATASVLQAGTIGSNLGLGSYNTSSDTWSFYQSGASGTGNFSSGIGHSINLNASSGDISFTGTLLTDDLTPIALANTGNGFNLIGNPYPSYINSGTLLTTSTNALLTETLWIWNQSTSSYDTHVSGENFQLAPGQGFFVQSDADGGNVAINETFQNHQSTDTFQKTLNTRPEIHVNITDGIHQFSSKIYYIEGTTTGFDNGYDGPIFGGTSNDFIIYTHAVANGEGRNLAIQSLPDNDYESMIIPIGIKAENGTEITISSTAINLPIGIDIYLEDKDENSFTLLDSSSNFTTTLTHDLDGIGRFYLHTTSQALSIDDANFNNISIYTSSNNNLRIVGLQSSKALIKIYNVLGKQVLNTSFLGTGVNNISIPNVRAGVYIVQLKTEMRTFNKKIIIK